MDRTQRTDITVHSSHIYNGNYLAFPFVVTSFNHPDNTVTTSSHRITEGHIRHFTGVRISYINDNTNFINPNIVLNYNPVRQIHISVVTQQ